MRRVAGVLVAGVLLLLGGGGCVAHPVGPTRTSGAFEGKATATAEDALSAVASGRLAAAAFADGHAFGPYAGSVVSDAEETASGVQGTFASIQPPGFDSDDLRDELLGVLGDAVDHLAALRIAVRREDAAAVADALGPVDDDATALRRFVEEHR